MGKEARPELKLLEIVRERNGARSDIPKDNSYSLKNLYINPINKNIIKILILIKKLRHPKVLNQHHQIITLMEILI